MVDKIKPLKFEEPTCGTELDFLPTETDPTEDFITAKGYTFECSDVATIVKDVNDEISFTDSEISDVTVKELKNGADLAQVGRYAIALTHNGTVGNGTFFGFSNLINGLDTPIVIPRDSTLKDLTFSNSNSSADFTLFLRKNSSVATAFYTITKTNSNFFTEIDIDGIFLQGDLIYVEYQDDGTNANDVGIILFLRND